MWTLHQQHVGDFTDSKKDGRKTQRRPRGSCECLVRKLYPLVPLSHGNRIQAAGLRWLCDERLGQQLKGLFINRIFQVRRDLVPPVSAETRWVSLMKQLLAVTSKNLIGFNSLYLKGKERDNLWSCWGSGSSAAVRR